MRVYVHRERFPDKQWEGCFRAKGSFIAMKLLIENLLTYTLLSAMTAVFRLRQCHIGRQQDVYCMIIIVVQPKTPRFHSLHPNGNKTAITLSGFCGLL